MHINSFYFGGVSLKNHLITNNKDLSLVSDEEIIGVIRQGNNGAIEFLINRYKSFVKSKARTYFLVGADKEDIIQEGMIGLFKAIRDFDNKKEISFKSFAELCVTRQMLTAIKTATRQKHKPLNSYISFNKPIYDEDSEKTLGDMLVEDAICDPPEMIISKEQKDGIEYKMEEVLSKFELEVVSLYLNGISYQQIAKITKRQVKAVDNALQRVKKKLEKYLQENNE